MNLKGRRKSTNVQDRRGSSGGGGGIDIGDILGKLGRGGGSGGSGGGGGGLPMGQMPGCSGGGGNSSCMLIAIIAIVLVVLLMCNGGSMGNLLGGCGEGGFGDIFTGQVNDQSDGKYTSSAEEDSLYEFTLQVLGSTEDIWTKEFQKMGRTYNSPELVIYSGRIQTGCGMGSSSTGPFYCSADRKVYIDLSFYETMRRQLGIQGDFAWAYVIAHEVGHHVQNELGTLSKAHAKMSQQSQTEANKTSVQIELQADFLAGLWGHDEQALFKSLDTDDPEEALSAAIKIGDDYLQRQAGYHNPQGYTHGTSEQRKKWFKKGFESGDINQGNTFAIPYDRL